jgi:hypothetical protein
MNNMQLSTTERLQRIDTVSLKKGDVIPPEEVAKIMGVEEDSKEFGLAAMQLRAFIERSFRNAGVNVRTCSAKNAVVILDDRGAHDYTIHRIHFHTKALQREQEQLQRVDTSEFTMDEQSKHERNIRIAAFILDGVKEAQREEQLETIDRITLEDEELDAIESSE